MAPNEPMVSRNPKIGWMRRSRFMVLEILLVVVLVLLLLGALPAWPYSRGWGYGPSGLLGTLLIILLVLVLLGVVG